MMENRVSSFPAYSDVRGASRETPKEKLKNPVTRWRCFRKGLKTRQVYLEIFPEIIFRRPGAGIFPVTE